MFVGAWIAPHAAAQLAAAEIEPALHGYDLRKCYATIALTAAPGPAMGDHRTVPAAAVLPADAACADPIAALPRIDYGRETGTGFPHGTCDCESYYQWEAPTPPYRLAELHRCVPKAARPDLVAGWDLHLHGAPYALHADLATPSHVMHTLITALIEASPEV